MAKASTTAVLEQKARAAAEKMGFELVDVCLDQEAGGRYLRLYIDRPEGISLDDCEAFHKTVRPWCEAVDYDFMEVSSPGLDRPLKKDRDFERNLGGEIEIHLFKPLEGSKRLTGILTGLRDGVIHVETPAGERQIPRKAAALVRPVVHLEGIEDVDPLETETEEEGPVQEG